MKSILPLPPTPSRVKYALTVPQSVLFADLSLRGSTREAFRAVFDFDYEPNYIAIDNGAMSWDYSPNEGFVLLLTQGRGIADAVRRFVDAMGSTSRSLQRVAKIVGPSSGRRKLSKEDLLEDLTSFWNAYELHMTSLFTFWNVEQALSGALIEGLRRSGHKQDIENGLARFLMPNEKNYFALERWNRERLQQRYFGHAAGGPKEQREAVASHIRLFGFLLAPFNVGAVPSVEVITEQLGSAPRLGNSEGNPISITGKLPPLSDLPSEVQELGFLSRQFAFWKTERLDVLALADSRVADLYADTAAALSVELDYLFSMTRREIEESLLKGKAVIDESVKATRSDGYCLLLHEGEISFRIPSTRKRASVQPSQSAASSGQAIQGVGASSGVIRGRVRVINNLEDCDRLMPGEVLVTKMTRPEMGVALDQAAGFVTDEGGMLCHAAIISREMKKPCVIATEIGTTILRNGMLVEVDGTAGIVTVLE